MSIENVLFRCGGGGNSKLKVASLTVTTQPTKLNYVQYEKLNLAGIQVMATFEDGVTANVTSAITTTPSITDLLNTVGTNTITVEWGGAKTTFNVTVQELVSISVTQAPDKIYYEPDDTLDLTGLVITGTSASLTGDLTSSCVYNPAEGTVLSEEGTVTVTATVGVFTTSFNVNVTSAETLYQQVKAMTTTIPQALWLAFVSAGCIAMVIAKGEQTSFIGKNVTINNTQSASTNWRIEDFSHSNSGNTCDLIKQTSVHLQVFATTDTKYYISSSVKTYLDQTYLPGFDAEILDYLKNFTQESVSSKIRIPTAYEMTGTQEYNQSKQSWETKYPSVSKYHYGESSSTTYYDANDYWTMSYYTDTYRFIFYWDNSDRKMRYQGYNSQASVLPIIRFGL